HLDCRLERNCSIWLYVTLKCGISNDLGLLWTTKEQFQTSFLVPSLSSCLVQMTLVLNCCLDVSIGIVVFSPTVVGGAQWVSPGCLCDVRNCRDICDSCTTEAGGGGDKCHSILSLLLIRSHAILMVMTFLLLVPLGVAISRYSRPVFPYSWFRAHAAVNSATLVLILLGLGAVLGHTGGKFTAGLHQIAGIICITLLLLQALCGYLRPAAGVSLQRRVFNAVHRINGATILGMGTLAMLLGSVIYRNSIYPLVLLVLVLGVVVELLFFLGLEIVMRRNYSSVMIYTYTHMPVRISSDFLMVVF
ncbi:Ferric-chelate reductase 1, partial [Geodia barretti]